MFQFAFKNRFVDQKGNPLVIKGGTLDDRFDPKALDSDKVHAWHMPVHSVHHPPEKALDFPDTLWLNTGERKLGFDFRLDMHGMIVSQRFIDACPVKLDAHFKIARLNVVNRKGATVSDREMFYAKPFLPKHVVDEDNSERVTGEVKRAYFSTTERMFDHFSLRPDISGDFIYPIDLNDCILIEKGVAETLQNAGLDGLEIVGLEDFVDRYNARNLFIHMDGREAEGM